MSDHRTSVADQAKEVGGGAQQLSTAEISKLLLASSVAATRPLLALIKFLIAEGNVSGDKLKAYLVPILVAEGFPTETKAMLDPIWKSFLAQIGNSQTGESNASRSRPLVPVDG